MPSREASLKVTLQNSSFNAKTRQMGAFMERTGRKMGEDLKGPLTAGFEAGKKAAGELFSSLKSTIGAAATLGGAVSVGAMVKGAVEAESSYIQLADAMTVASGRAVESEEAQALVGRAAQASAASFEEARAAANQLAGAGDLDQVEDAIRRSVLQARRLGVETDLVARAMSRLMAKGIADSAAEAELLLENMNAFGRAVLGIDPDEAIDPNDIAEFAAFTNQAGSNVNEMTALLTKTGGAAKDLGGALEIVEELGLVLNTRKGLAELGKASRDARKATDLSKGGVENLLAILETGSPRAIKALEDALGTDRAKAALGELLGKDLSIKIAKGTATREELKAIGANLRDELKSAGDQTAVQNRIYATNTKLLDTSQAKFQEALNKLQTSFSRPETVAAINKLADKLPILAEKIASFLEFVVDNPKTAAAGLVLGKIALAVGGAAVQEAAIKGISQLMISVGAKLGVGSAVAGAGGVGAAGAGGAAAAGAGGAATAAGAGLATAGAAAAAAGAAGFLGTQALLDNTETGGAVKKFMEGLGDSVFEAIHGTTDRAQGRGIGAAAVDGKKNVGEQASEKATKAMEQLAKHTAQVTKSMQAVARAAGAAASSTRGPLTPADPTPGSAATG